MWMCARVASVDASRLKSIQQDGVDQRAAGSVNPYVDPLGASGVDAWISASRTSKDRSSLAVPLHGAKPKIPFHSSRRLEAFLEASLLATEQHEDVVQTGSETTQLPSGEEVFHRNESSLDHSKFARQLMTQELGHRMADALLGFSCYVAYSIGQMLRFARV